jgi:CheY-like chemotaxis protein
LVENKEEYKMAESILNGKSILAVDDEPDILEILEEEILGYSPSTIFEKATTYDEATKKLEFKNYDVVVLDIMGVRGFDLLDQAVKRKFRVTMLTAHALTPEALKRSFEMGARAYLPKEKLGEIVPFLEDVFKYEYLPGWKRLFEKLEGFFNERWGQYWKKSEEKFWMEFDENWRKSEQKFWKGDEKSSQSK